MPRPRGRARIVSGRRKKVVPSNLKNEVKKKKRIPIVKISIGIIGRPRSGRKTMAYRLTHERLGIIEDGEVPIQITYSGNVEGICPSFHPVHPLGKCIAMLTAYIIEPPSELPRRNPPLYWDHWTDLNCLLFTFDIRNQRSFFEATSKLARYRQLARSHQFEYSVFFQHICVLVGSKGDTRHLPPPLPDDPEDHVGSEYLDQPPVTRTLLLEAAAHGVEYFECSAKNNRGMFLLLTHFLWKKMAANI